MAQERFADIVERFTHGYAEQDGQVSAQLTKQWQEELDRQRRRFANLARMVGNPTEPKTGQTPRQEIYRFSSGAIRAEGGPPPGANPASR